MEFCHAEIHWFAAFMVLGEVIKKVSGGGGGGGSDMKGQNRIMIIDYLGCPKSLSSLKIYRYRHFITHTHT